jgi:hypothetical protein
LECSPQLIPTMPPVSWQQIAELLPSRLVRAYDLLTLPSPPLQFNPSSGTQDQIDASLPFLNYPPHTGPVQILPALVTYTLSGWYHKTGSEWIRVEVNDTDGSPAEVRVDRNPSADLQQAFKDPAASRQRFVIRTRCSDDCVMRFQTRDGEEADKPLAELRRAPIGFEVGHGRVHIDSTGVGSNPGNIKPRPEEISNRIRMAITSHYGLVFLPVLVLGLAAFLATTLLQLRRAASNMCFIIALMSWMQAMLLAALLILIDITSFPALQAFYLAPAYFFLVCGAIFSCAACLQLFNAAPRYRMHASVQAKSCSGRVP